MRRPLRAVRRIAARLVAGLLLLVLAGAAYQAIATEIDRRYYPPPGQLGDVGGYRLHIYCLGATKVGTPTVILDAHNGSTSSN